MGKVCLIAKKKVILVCILEFIYVVGMVLSLIWQILILPSILLIVLANFISFKYIRCSNCDSRFYITDLRYGTSTKYCKKCGLRIEYK